jgi:uncharacterized membrane protein (DUF485 family)
MNTTKQIEQTIIIGTSWFLFILTLLSFNPAKLNIWQITAAILTSGLIAVGTVALSWIKSCL